MDPYKFMYAQREKYGDLFTFVLIGRKMTVGLGPKVSERASERIGVLTTI